MFSPGLTRTCTCRSNYILLKCLHLRRYVRLLLIEISKIVEKWVCTWVQEHNYSIYLYNLWCRNILRTHSTNTFTHKLYTICNKHYLQWQKAIMPFTDLQRNFPTKQVHLQFNFPIKNVQFWVFQIAKIYIYVFFLGTINACCTRNRIYLDISWYNTSYSHSRDIPDCQSSY